VLKYHLIQTKTARLIEHGLTSPPTQYGLYGRRFLQELLEKKYSEKL